MPTSGVETIHVPCQGSLPAIQDFRAGAPDPFHDMVVQNSEMIHETTMATLQLPEVRQALIDLGISHQPMSDMDYTSFVDAQIDVREPLIVSVDIEGK